VRALAAGRSLRAVCFLVKRRPGPPVLPRNVGADASEIVNKWWAWWRRENLSSWSEAKDPSSDVARIIRFAPMNKSIFHSFGAARRAMGPPMNKSLFHPFGAARRAMGPQDDRVGSAARAWLAKVDEAHPIA